ncbi:ABC transporter ATP-binding protein [Cellulomonas hominis]|uniref:ABC transporter ATP-binding protein n=1 Tax=Cellulomonas hominis TaxID=156981 RepID=UPI00144496E7|nr:ATP-binding cassette domain-containing protein [Cellulomonas hominis]NKY09722.1 ATP-binding cassette domain-containing protein [Cellulomonas hominis]
MIEATGLTKTYDGKVAVDGISFTVRPGVVTGFLGPNGAGKSTTMRMIVGLDRPTAGSVTVNGRRYADHRAPLGEVGALLDAKAVHAGRSARAHLLALAATHGIGARRVTTVMEETGLLAVARKRAGTFSLGMGQRLGIAAALLGDPRTLILDEPVNGLDPEGVAWVRNLLRGLAAQGRTVLLSSHLMSEMALTADHLIVLGRGRVLADAPVAEVVGLAGTRVVRVRTPTAAALTTALQTLPGVQVSTIGPDLLDVTGAEAPEVAQIAATAGVVLHELAPVQVSLEDAYMQLTATEVEYRSGSPGPSGTRATRATSTARTTGGTR